jgi:hypothetical protein
MSDVILANNLVKSSRPPFSVEGLRHQGKFSTQVKGKQDERSQV